MSKKPYSPGSAKSSPSKSAVPNKSFAVTEASELLAFLLAHLNQGRNSVKSLLAHGQVYVNDHVETKYNYPLQPGQTVMIRKEREKEKIPLIGLTILHEDDHVIVASKDAGLLTIATDKETDLTAYRQLMAHVREDDPKSRIFIVHRLDRDTSGVLMFAKSEAVQQKLQEEWQTIVKERSYVALVEGEVKRKEGTVSSWLKESKTLRMYSSPHPNDGQHAVTHYKLLQAGKAFSLMEVHLETGRKNQIRVHMQDIGHPIAGDKKYGSQTKPIGRLGLHARILAFEHPVTGELLKFDTGIPKQFYNPFRSETAKPDRRSKG
ncbi:RluA family pseudouridine synthase [Paenibacillus glycanilyticus]|uniref:RluA family pseudouridine synthase n=1 Tax=Paenibacillus glycanilyticus TaxID=126569 RepID=UPI0020402A04|nr:RluA family pseudouridine synthase [Paenibacillus glycanilyticus]MCM3628852.1 RluA family pseudouridine synthase [Paenibacillus glycanilyticus]